MKGSKISKEKLGEEKIIIISILICLKSDLKKFLVFVMQRTEIHLLVYTMNKSSVKLYIDESFEIFSSFLGIRTTFRQLKMKNNEQL